MIGVRDVIRSKDKYIGQYDYLITYLDSYEAEICFRFFITCLEKISAIKTWFYWEKQELLKTEQHYKDILVGFTNALNEAKRLKLREKDRDHSKKSHVPSNLFRFFIAEKAERHAEYLFNKYFKNQEEFEKYKKDKLVLVKTKEDQQSFDSLKWYLNKMKEDLRAHKIEMWPIENKNCWCFENLKYLPDKWYQGLNIDDLYDKYVRRYHPER